jgi:ribA/ribD-fused uncharacterized protein
VTTELGTLAIRFHRLTDEYGCFTNFARCPVLLDGAWWPTAEHYFQSRKFADPGYVERIRKANTPSLAARLGRTRDIPLRPDWAQVRVPVMRRAVRAKFVQHPRLAARLLATGNRPLVEDTRGDQFWGDGGDGTGRNVNGQILMELRAQLRVPDPVARRATQCVDARRPWVLFGGAVVAAPLRDGRHAPVPAALRLLRAVAEESTSGPSWTTEHGTVTVLPGNADPSDAVRTAATEPDVRYVHDPLYRT